MAKRWDRCLRRHALKHGFGMFDVTVREPGKDWFEIGMTGPINSSQIERLSKLLDQFAKERKTFPAMDRSEP